MTLAPRLAFCRVCHQAATRFLPGKKRSFYCDTHGPQSAEAWLKLRALDGSPAPALPARFKVDAPTEDFRRPEPPARNLTPAQAGEGYRDHSTSDPREIVRDAALSAAGANVAEQALESLLRREYERGKADSPIARADALSAQALARELQEVQRERDHLQGELHDAEQRMTDFERERDNLRGRLLAGSRELENANSNIRRLEDQKRYFEKLGHDASADALKIDADLRATRERLKAVELERDTVIKVGGKQEAEISDLAGKLALMARSNANLSTENEELRKLLDDATKPPEKPWQEIAADEVARREAAPPQTDQAVREELRARVEEVPAPRERALKDLVSALPRGKRGLPLTVTNAAEHSWKKLSPAQQEATTTILQFLSRSGFNTGVRAETLEGQSTKQHKIVAVRVGSRGRIILEKAEGYYEVLDITDRADKKWYNKK